MMSLDIEIFILRGFLTAAETATWKQNSNISAETRSMLEYLLEGNFKAVLLSRPVLDLLAGDGTYREGDDIEAFLEGCITLYLSRATNEDQNKRELTLMALAVACLHLFAQSNWTGPSVSFQISDLLPPAVFTSQQQQTLVAAIHSSLLLDGESVYTLVANPFLLLLARVILVKCSSKMITLQLVPWWVLRYINLHQQILEYSSPQLHSLAQSTMDKVLKCPTVLSEQRKLAIQFHLECTYISLIYFDYKSAKEHIQRAQELSGLSIKMTGALGKRTRFQQKHLAQLILEVNRKDDHLGETNEDSPTCTPVANLPKDCNLNDDTILDKINLTEPDQYELPELHAEEQAVILGICTDIQKNNPVHKLTEEELLAFTSCILSQPKFWGVHVVALCLRSKLEKRNFRRVERAMKQMQVIADHFEDQNCPVTDRLKVFYCSQAPPRWHIQKQLASLLIDLGCSSSALLIYENLELWEDAVICHERLGQHGKAEQIVRRELEKKETPTLYCLLGDILKDHQYYDQAWELSGRRSARAMRSKALLYLHNKDFQNCVDCFERSVKINPIQLGVWFSLGCAYFTLESYEGAAKAFHKCVELEPDNAEAWNNLSTAYILQKKKKKAFHTLQEALKCNYEHWQIWENYITVCTDIGAFPEAVTAYHRLMDLKENYKDIQILQILVRAVIENLTDSHGVLAVTIQSKVKELLGRVSARHSNDSDVWQQYALLYGNGRSSNTEDNEKALQFLSKAHRCEVHAGGWEKEPALFKEVLKRAINLGETTISCSKKKSTSSEALQMLSSIRLSLRSLSTKAKQMHTDVATGELHPELQEGVAAVDQLIADVLELSGRLCDQSQ